MKLLSTILISFLTIISTYSVVIHYHWEEGESYKYQVETRADYISSGTNMGLKQITVESFQITSAFEIYVVKIEPDGLIYADLNLLRFEIKTTKGQQVAALFTIPQNAFSSPVTIDQQGNICYESRLQLVLSSKAHFVVANKTGVNVLGMNKEIHLNSLVQFNTYDGNTADILAECYQKSKSVTANLNEYDPIIDLIPYDFLRLFVIPDQRIEQDLSFSQHKHDYKVLITADVIGKEKIHFSSSLLKKGTRDNSGTLMGYPSSEVMNTSELFDLKQGMMLSLEGTSTKKESHLSTVKELKRHTKILYIIP
tara:strand:- start:39 stop:968 length:930 start_codon:yes stop_codon:yes gene_type:complete